MPTMTGDTGPAGTVSADRPERTARREATRQRILDAAREVFAERGVIGGTVEEICDRAGFTRGAFYSNFSDKEDVLQALVEREQSNLLTDLEASLADVEPELEEASDFAAALAPIVERILRSIPMDRQLLLVQTELEIHAIRQPGEGRSLRDGEARFRERIAGFIADAMARHDRELLVEPGVAADAVLGIMERGVRRALLAGDGDPDATGRAVLPGLMLALSRPRTSDR
jgi:AcrR family transcriptional regulator